MYRLDRIAEIFKIAKKEKSKFPKEFREWFMRKIFKKYKPDEMIQFGLDKIKGIDLINIITNDNNFKNWILSNISNSDSGQKMIITNSLIRNNNDNPKYMGFLKKWKLETDMKYREDYELAMKGPPNDNEDLSDPNLIYNSIDEEEDFEL